MAKLSQTLADIARAIVDFPDDVNVEERNEDGTVVLTLTVAESDTGKVIGQQGRVARSIRTIMKAAAGLVGCRVSVEIR